MDNREKTIAEVLNKWTAEFKAGKSDRVLFIMEFCQSAGIDTPEWVNRYFRECVRRYRAAEARTLDQAFGVRRPSGWNQRKARERQNRGLVAHTRMRYLTQPLPQPGSGIVRPPPISVERAIAETAEKMGMSEPTARRWYYDKVLFDESGLFSKKQKK